MPAGHSQPRFRRSTAAIRGSLPLVIQRALSFDAAHAITHPIASEPFYAASAAPATPPGTLLSLEAAVDSSQYSLPPSTALSRFTYQSSNLAGQPVPVSAYILWPFTPRVFPPSSSSSSSSPQSSSSAPPIVAWAHGTSGLTPSAAPSNTHALWQHFLAPYQLALQGYVVVATDYAGLGIGQTTNSPASSGDEHDSDNDSDDPSDSSTTPIKHEYLASRSQATDVLHSISAARAAFPKLRGGPWVAVGHSQGGAAVWALAQLLHEHASSSSASDNPSPAPSGYLGGVALSPVTSILRERPTMRDIFVAACSMGIEGYTACLPASHPAAGFRRADILTDEGLRRVGVIEALGTLLAPAFALLQGVPLLHDGWQENAAVREYFSKGAVVGVSDAEESGEGKLKPWLGPLLAVHGDEDPILDIAQCERAVGEARKVEGRGALRYVRVKGVTHNASMTSVQWMWLDWIRARFEGREVEEEYAEEVVESLADVENYQKEMNWFVEKASEFYQTP